MTSRGSIEVRPGLVIPADELRYAASRSGGPGGQHVNKVNSRVTLYFDLHGSTVLSATQKRRIRARLSTRIGRSGELRVHAQRHRSQAANRELAAQRMAELLAFALRETKRRKKTRISRAERERRLSDKRHRAATKRNRSYRRGSDGD